MSPKYRLRPQTNIIESKVHAPSRGHAIFLPLLMVAVVGLTFLLVSTSKPMALITEQKLAAKVKNPPIKLAAITPQRIELDDINLNLSKINQFQPADEEPVKAKAAPVQSAEKFVSGRKLDIVEPLDELEPVARAQVVDSDYILKSITYSDPELEHQRSWSKQPSGLPAPLPAQKKIVKAKPIPSPPIGRATVQQKSYPTYTQLTEPSCEMQIPAPQPESSDHCPDLARLENHELQITLPGGSQRIRVGDFLNGDQQKFREVGQFLLGELANGNRLNASVISYPDVKIGITSIQPPSKGNHCGCAVPIIQSAAEPTRFTPWMTPQELNHHILSKSCGNSKTFWDDGNWITAVEGRVDSGIQQYRIIHEKAPKKGSFQWVYRIAQTREDFSKKIESQRKNGFRLIQSQMYLDHNNVQRYQAVWHRL